MVATDEPKVKRFEEQRWLLDNVIETVGVEWDQPRLAYMSAPAGLEAAGEFRATAARIRKYADIDREFAAAAQRRENKAAADLGAGNPVTARESYFIAALLWATARWPIHSATETLLGLEARMNECYARFMDLAPRPIERVEIPLGDQTFPAYLHLPHAPAPGETFPCVMTSSGMDGCKEMAASLYGDKLLERGIAVLAADGPGQGECFSRRLLVTEDNHGEAAAAAFDWLAARPEIDGTRLAYRGTSFASYFGVVAAAALGGRMAACATIYVIHEPGCHTIFNTASPTFKMRFMYMAGYTDEAAFDAFAKKLDLRERAASIACPFLVVAGSDDELSPIGHTHDLMARVTAPRKLVVYEGARHAIGAAASAALGPNPNNVVSDWLADRRAGKPMTSEYLSVDSRGGVTAQPY